MLIIPAIDIKNGKVVRLKQGKNGTEKIYYENPVEAAIRWENENASLLHIVDLDGAFAGEIKNFSLIKKIRENLKIKLEVGGGIRNIETAKKLISIGVDFIIISTGFFKDINFKNQIVSNYPDKTIVSLDINREKIGLSGWQDFSDLNLEDAIKEIEKAGIKRVIFTDITRDGMLLSPDFDRIKYLSIIAKNLKIIISGGINSIDDIKKIKSINENIQGIIIGTALYENKIEFKKAKEICES